ncbi:MAG: hypothetical protein OK441_02150 [Thaumarchaeota archaeon]|nr:hypothetical protein [Nitrososphaerota archaeon]
MIGRASWAIITVVIAPVLSLYLAVLYWLVQDPAFLPANNLEAIVLGTQVIRLVIVLSVRRLRRSSINAIDVLTAEVLVVPFLFLAGTALGSREYLLLGAGVLVDWGSALLIVFPAFAIYKVGEMLNRGARLRAVIPSATGLFVLLVLLLSATAQSSATLGASGLVGFDRLVLGAILSQGSAASLEPLVTAAGAALYLGLVAYSAIETDHVARRLDVVLIFPVLGTATALAWSLLASLATTDTVFIFGVPSLVLIAIMWLGTRAD